MSNTHSNQQTSNKIETPSVYPIDSLANSAKTNQDSKFTTPSAENQVLAKNSLPKDQIYSTTNTSTTMTEKINSLSSLQQTTRNYSLGSTDQFWVENLYYATNGKDNNGDGRTFQQGDWAEAMYQVTGVLINITQHAYIFVDQNQ